VLDAAGRWTSVAVRFNSGLPIRDNAAEVVRLVDQLVDAWPVRVDEVAFVGHSMGGLVVRAAAAAAAPSWWAGRVSHVVLLGSPHAGAPLERFVERSVPLLRRLPEVEPFAAILDERSAGIRDLHDGIGVDAALWPQAAYHCVGATLGTGERAWAGRMFGDLLVLVDSARGTSAEVQGDFRHLTGAHHFDLLNHPEITADLLRWLGPPRGHVGGSTNGSSG
jgi:pimeloyl-ACP methyl ester carboxylesterase